MHIDFDSVSVDVQHQRDRFLEAVSRGEVVTLPGTDADGYAEGEARALLDALVCSLRASFESTGTANGALAAVAFSGGVDSTLALHLCCQALGTSRVRVSARRCCRSAPRAAFRLVRDPAPAFSTQALLGVSPSLSALQRTRAHAVAASMGLELSEVPTAEGSRDRYVTNDGEACFVCKTELYSTLDAVARAALAGSDTAAAERPSSSSSVGEGQTHLRSVVLVNGTNADDLRRARL